MPCNERKTIIESINYIDEVIDFKDDEIGSCINALEKAKVLFLNDDLLFANGGDRNDGNIPEMSVDGIEFIFSVGGDDKKIHHRGFLKTGSIIMRKDYGDPFIIYLKKSR